MTRSQTNTAVRPAQADSKLNGVAKASTERSPWLTCSRSSSRWALPKARATSAMCSKIAILGLLIDRTLALEHHSNNCLTVMFVVNR